MYLFPYFSAVGTYRIMCRSKENPLYLMEHDTEERIVGTTDSTQATKFIIEQECANEFAIRKVDEGNASAYIAIVNQPKITTQQITKKNTRMSLKDPLQEEKVAVDTDNWMIGNGWYFIRCGNGKLCVKEIAQGNPPQYQLFVEKSSKAHNNRNSFMLFHLEHAN